MNMLIPTRFLPESVLLQEIPRSQYIETPKCVDPLNEKSRFDFFKKLRKPSKHSSQSASQGSCNSSTRRAGKSAKKWHLKLNLAVWLTLKEPTAEPIALVLSYQDSKGAFSVIVDEDINRSDSMMLSGNAEIEVIGEMKSVQLRCTGLIKEGRVVPHQTSDIHVKLLSSSEGAENKEKQLKSG